MVDAVLKATLDQLGKHGYEALSIEEVAGAANVNKTSVYRRWATKSELVLAALHSRKRDEPPFVESGDLEGDLVAILTRKAQRIATPSGRVLARALMTVSGDPKMVAELRSSRFGLPTALIAAAIERGDLPERVDASFAAELLMAPIVNRIVVLDEAAPAAFIASAVRHTLAGLGYRARRRRKKQL